MPDEHAETLRVLLMDLIPTLDPLPNEQQAEKITKTIEQAYLLGIMWGVKSSLKSIKEGLLASCFQMDEMTKHLETHKIP